MTRSLLSQRYNENLFLVKKRKDDEFCRLFWNPFTTSVDAKVKTVYKPKGQRKKLRRKHHCPDCTAIFRRPASLMYHVAFNHTGEQLNVCPDASCHLNFQFPYQLASHRRTSGHHGLPGVQ